MENDKLKKEISYFDAQQQISEWRTSIEEVSSQDDNMRIEGKKEKKKRGLTKSPSRYIDIVRYKLVRWLIHLIYHN
jgi:hypothetical protein